VRLVAALDSPLAGWSGNSRFSSAEVSPGNGEIERLRLANVAGGLDLCEGDTTWKCDEFFRTRED
jgi:hypothetical protein